MALGVAAASLVGAAVWWNTKAPDCAHATIERLPSPDGRLVAIIEEYTCDVGIGGDAITAGVHLRTATQPFREIVLLGVDTGGYAEDRPIIAWSAPNVLRVTVPMESFLKILTRHAEGVRVDLHFDPDDPTGRAAWLKEIGHSPDPVDVPTDP